MIALSSFCSFYVPPVASWEGNRDKKSRVVGPKERGEEIQRDHGTGEGCSGTIPVGDRSHLRPPFRRCSLAAAHILAGSPLVYAVLLLLLCSAATLYYAVDDTADV